MIPYKYPDGIVTVKIYSTYYLFIVSIFYIVFIVIFVLLSVTFIAQNKKYDKQ